MRSPTPLRTTRGNPAGVCATFWTRLTTRSWHQSWASWRRSEDYYNEGALLWLDVDTLIRELSQGQRSLDDFARNFFGVDDGNIGPKLYDFDDVLAALNTIQPYDWASFLRARLDNLDRDPLDGVTRAGYRLTFTDTAGKYTESAEKTYEFTSFFYSLGLNMGKGGKVGAILWDSPAFAAGLAPGIQIMAVNGIAYENDRLKEAVKNSPNTTAPSELINKDDDHFRVVRIDYHDGPRYPHLERVEGTPPRLDGILAAK